MLPQMPFCPFERTSTTTVVSELDVINPTGPNEEKNALIVLSARAIGSLGFGLSVLAIWLRWLSPTVVVGDEFPPELTKIINRRRRPEASSERRAPPHSEIIRVERSSTPPKRSFRERPQRVSFADLLHLEGEGAPEVKPPSPSSSLTLTPSLASGDTTARELETPHSSNSTTYLPSKAKTTFRTNSKRQSLPPIPIEESSSPLTTTEIPKNTLARSLTQSWRHSRSKSTISSDTETNASDTGSTCRSQLSRTSSLRIRSSSPNSTCRRRSLGSAIFARRTSTRSNHSPSPRPRTSPYEAPYFASPPIPFDNTNVRSRSTRLYSEHTRPTGSIELPRDKGHSRAQTS